MGRRDGRHHKVSSCRSTLFLNLICAINRSPRSSQFIHIQYSTSRLWPVNNLKAVLNFIPFVMISTMQQTSPTEVCGPCTLQQQPTLNAAPASTKHVNRPIYDIIPFHRVATIVVIASIAILVLLSLIGWLSYRRQEPFVRICCIRRRDTYGSSPKAGKGRDTSTVKKSRSDVENALSSRCDSLASSISEIHTPRQHFVSMNESSHPDPNPLDGQEHLPPIRNSLYYADIVNEFVFGHTEH